MIVSAPPAPLADVARQVFIPEMSSEEEDALQKGAEILQKSLIFEYVQNRSTLNPRITCSFNPGSTFFPIAIL